MAKHILVHPDGTEQIIDIEKGNTLAQVAIAAGISGGGSGFRLRSTSALSQSFDLPAILAKPDVTRAPSISGPAAVGSTVTLDEGSYTGQPDLTLRLFRGTTLISPDGLSYTLTSADEGETLTLEIDAENAEGKITAISAPFGPVVAAGAVTDQVVRVGANTLSTASGASITDSNHSTVTDATDAGTGTATGYTLTAGRIVPASDGSLAGQDGATIVLDSGVVVTLSVTDNTYSVWSILDMSAAILHAQENNLGAGSTVRIEEDIDNPDELEISSSGGTTPVFDPVLTITGARNKQKVGKYFGLRHWGGLRIFDLEFDGYDISVGDLITIDGDCRNITFDECWMHGVERDPLGDYSASGSYTNVGAPLQIVGSGRGYPGGIHFTNCLMEHFYSGGSIILGREGGLTFANNEWRYFYADSPQWSVNEEAFDANDEYDSPIRITDNKAHNYLGDARDAPNPHIDMMSQAISKAATDGHRLTNVEICRNCSSENSASRGRTSQGITSFTDAGGRLVFVDALIEDNTIVATGNHHITLQIDGVRVRRNTLVQPGLDFDTVPDHPPRVNFQIAEGATGTVVLENNIWEGPPHLINSDGSDYVGPSNIANNVELGFKGETIAYSEAFVGPEWDLEDPDAQKAAFAPIVGGPADVLSDNAPNDTPNAIVDGGFDDPGAWLEGIGMIIQNSAIVFDGTNSDNSRISEPSNDYNPIEGGSEYELSFTIEDVEVGGSLRVELDYFQGPNYNDGQASVATSDRIGGSTIPVSEDGVYGPYVLPAQPPADATNARITIIAKTAGMVMRMSEIRLTKIS